MATNHDSQTRPFRRAHNGRLLGGVSGAVAARFGVDLTTIRIAFVLLSVLGGGGALLYGAGWLLIPDETDVSIAESFVKNLGWH